MATVTNAAAAHAGVVDRRSYGGGYHSVGYVPATVDRSRPAPLLVVLHACNQTPEHLQATGDLDAEADRGRFVVLYAGFDHTRRTLPCWRARSETRRGRGDPAAVAAIVRAAISRRTPPIDPSRVYAAGVSSGGMMVANLGATYPELFAGLAISAGCAYRAPTCIGARPSGSTAALARAALRAMGSRRHLMPVMIVHGDRDAVVPPAHALQLLEQWRLVNNLILTGAKRGPIAAVPARTRALTVAGGLRTTVEYYDAPRGHAVLERWSVHGLGHQEGGSARSLWAFLRQFRNPGRTT
ncbi:PHB depolymerase family esterase [Solirubrobacter phytolaccae]|uniref:PHB depolymerase family esterase n=1 Tax=Solirubrobacter phytolaccae TaxID=1404360 RepID=A0A9X3NEH6_9ACTN|nr:PHB depolymerase family esterase [Solirubrobacter phytolaccae]MDA0184993.1 PHB depolymerase family esterase [Solirubrobacter phytolaccae]